MGKSDDKTNVCRVLDQKKVSYKTHVCPDAEGLSGDEIAAVLNENPEQAFKTLVTVGKTGKNYVFVVPVNKELDLKKAAKAVGEKSIEMIKSKELLPLTGYVHGRWYDMIWMEKIIGDPAPSCTARWTDQRRMRWGSAGRSSRRS